MTLAGATSFRFVIRRIELRSVIRFSLLLYASIWAVLLVAGMALWVAASIAGVRANIEGLIADLFASNTFGFKGAQVLRASLFGGGVLVLLGTGANVVVSALYNLISELIGGVAVVVDDGEAKVTAGGRKAGRKPLAKVGPSSKGL